MLEHVFFLTTVLQEHKNQFPRILFILTSTLPFLCVELIRQSDFI